MRSALPGPARVAWEDESRPPLSRLFGTFGQVFGPSASAERLAEGAVGPAATFAVLTLLPLLLVVGIMPFTRTLQFAEGFSVKVLHDATAAEMWVDVLRASGIGFLLHGAGFLSWALPFVSLNTAFAAEQVGRAQARAAALRSAFYCGWVLPGSIVVFYVSTWALPTEIGKEALLLLVLALQLGPGFLLLVHRQVLAQRLGASIGGMLAVAFVPLLVYFAAGSLIETVAARLLPEMPEETEEAAEQESVLEGA